ERGADDFSFGRCTRAGAFGGFPFASRQLEHEAADRFQPRVLSRARLSSAHHRFAPDDFQGGNGRRFDRRREVGFRPGSGFPLEREFFGGRRGGAVGGGVFAFYARRQFHAPAEFGRV